MKSMMKYNHMQLVFLALASIICRCESRKGKGSSLKPSDKIKGILVGAESTDLQILSCDFKSVTIQGAASVNVTKGSFLIKVGGDGDIASCSSCTPLFRKVLSVSVASSGTMTVKTAFAKMGELFDKSVLNQNFKSQLIEPLAGCSHSGVVGGTKVMPGEDSSSKIEPVAFEADPPRAPTSPTLSVAATGSNCDPLWQIKNSDGRCTHTNCYVGKTGNPINCFSCKSRCNNGCGADGSPFNTNGNFIFFDFGPGCCNHDYCYSSNTNTKEECDSTFYRQLSSQCNPFSKSISFVRRIGLLTIGSSQIACHVLASIFYLLVSNLGDDAYKSAQEEQKAHEETEECVAKCPTTQSSGGQGVTTLTIDLLKASGTFEVSYQMYTVPDSLSVYYEGSQIFSTGGLVSGGATTLVNFAGRSTIIQVTIDAPLDGTLWDVFVGCPSS